MDKKQKLLEAMRTAVTVLRDLEALAGEVNEELTYGNCEHPLLEGGEACMEAHGMDQDDFDDMQADVNRAAESIEAASVSLSELINSIKG